MPSPSRLALLAATFAACGPDSAGPAVNPVPAQVAKDSSEAPAPDRPVSPDSPSSPAPSGSAADRPVSPDSPSSPAPVAAEPVPSSMSVKPSPAGTAPTFLGGVRPT